MLAGRSDEALEVGVEALALARQFGDERLESRALITNGTAKGQLGGSGTAELERGIELAERANAMTEYVRGTNNLAQEFLVVGDLASTGELYDIALERVDRLGLKSATAWLLGQKISHAYLAGNWEEFARLSERYRAVIARMPGHYLEHQLAGLEATIMTVRADPAAEAAWARALELCYVAGDPQAIGPQVARRARVLLEQGRPAEVRTLGDEILALQDEHGALYYTWLIDLAWLLVDLGREAEMQTIASGGVWLEIAQAIVRHDFAAAAEELERIGMRTDEAYARLRTAEELASEGRHPEAQPHLERALAFYRSVGASTYVRRAEVLLPASA